MTADDRVARAALLAAVEPGHDRLFDLVSSHGAPAVLELLLHDDRPDGLSPGLWRGARSRLGLEGGGPCVDLERLLPRAAAVGLRLVVPGDAEWPAHRLSWALDRSARPGSSPPLGLWVGGDHALADAVERSAAVVGARAASPYGVRVAGELGHDLVAAGWTVVSGAAFGIDAAAHRGALVAAPPPGGSGAPTVAVLACGADVDYPRAHGSLLARVRATGLVVSEQPPGAMATRVRFLVRNRLIAGLSRGTVVVEAAARSGSLSTARLAREMSRCLAAVPGPVTSAMSVGCHALLRDPGEDAPTALVTCAADVVSHLGAVGEVLPAVVSGPVDPRDGLDHQVRRVLDAVPVHRAAGVSSIARVAGVGPTLVLQVLPVLAQARLVERADAGWRLTALGASGTAR